MIRKKQKIKIQELKDKKPEKIIKSELITLLVYPQKEEFNKFGVLINKDYIKKSVLRNKIKRIIFDNVKNWQNHKKSFLFKIKPQTSLISKKEIKEKIIQEVNFLLKKYDNNLQNINL